MEGAWLGLGSGLTLAIAITLNLTLALSQPLTPILTLTLTLTLVRVCSAPVNSSGASPVFSTESEVETLSGPSSVTE